MHGTNVFLLGAIIAQRFANGLYDSRDRCVRNDAAVPNLLDEFVSADEAVRVLDLVGGAICLVNSDNERDSGLLTSR